MNSTTSMADTIQDEPFRSYLQSFSFHRIYYLVISLAIFPLGISALIRNRHTVFAKKYATNTPTPANKFLAVPIEAWLLLILCVPTLVGVAFIVTSSLAQIQNICSWTWEWLPIISAPVLCFWLHYVERKFNKAQFLVPYWKEKERLLMSDAGDVKTEIEDTAAPEEKALIEFTDEPTTVESQSLISEPTNLEAQPLLAEKNMTLPSSSAPAPRRTWGEWLKSSTPALPADQLTPLSIGVRFYAITTAKVIMVWTFTLQTLSAMVTMPRADGNIVLFASFQMIFLFFSWYRFIELYRFTRWFVKTQVEGQ